MDATGSDQDELAENALCVVDEKVVVIRLTAAFKVAPRTSICPSRKRPMPGLYSENREPGESRAIQAIIQGEQSEPMV